MKELKVIYLPVSVRKMRLCIGFILVIASTITGCNPRKCGGQYYIQQEIKDYGYFLKGSYWVYQNDSTLQLDSFVVVFDSIGSYSYPVGTEGCNQMSPPAISWHEYSNCIAKSSISDDSIKYYCTHSHVTFTRNENQQGIYYGNEVRDYIDPSAWETIDYLILNGLPYFNIYKSEYFPGATVYFVQNVGVIKSEVLDDSTGNIDSWSLLQYDVIQ